jgi:receptor protein-tyrosine kinase
MNLIEQAARRLEELRRSGVDIPSATQPNVAGDTTVAPLARSRRVPSSLGSARQDATAGDPAMPAAKTVEIDLQRLAAMGYVTADTPRTQIASEFRVIKRPILKNVYDQSAAPVERANLIMVTSSLPGEGKTFVALNLAISMAMELDTTVLLIDADVSRPSILQRLGLEAAPGLLDVLQDPSRSLGDVLLRTNIERLSILPAGAPSGRATELLASVQMTRLLDDLGSRYSDRILVFDAPPLLPSTESGVLASHMGQLVMVVEAERTPQQVVARAMAMLEACPIVLPLLNKTSHAEAGYYYGYYAPEDKPS